MNVRDLRRLIAVLPGDTPVLVHIGQDWVIDEWSVDKTDGVLLFPDTEGLQLTKVAYAPANAAGEKPYIVEYRDWATLRTKTVYVSQRSDAGYRAVGRSRPGMYVRSVRRALWGETPDTRSEEPS